jgi:hypothetical protein
MKQKKYLLLVLPRPLAVGDASVIHPAAASFAEGNARTHGLAAATGTAEIALRSAPASFQPFHPECPICTSLTCQWATLHNAAPGLWSGPARELEGTRLAPILVDAQQLYG